MTDLEKLIEEAKKQVDAMSPAELAEMHRAQRRSFMRAEASFGSDADEEEYRQAVAYGDEAEIARLETEAFVRVAAVEEYLDAREVENGYKV